MKSNKSNVCIYLRCKRSECLIQAFIIFLRNSKVYNVSKIYFDILELQNGLMQTGCRRLNKTYQIITGSKYNNFSSVFAILVNFFFPIFLSVFICCIRVFSCVVSDWFLFKKNDNNTSKDFWYFLNSWYSYIRNFKFHWCIIWYKKFNVRTFRGSWVSLQMVF